MVRGHAVLGRPVGGLLALGEPLPGLPPEQVIPAPLGVLAGAMASAAQQEQFPIGAEREGVPSHSQKHAVHRRSALQGQHIGALLVHPGEIHPRKVDKGKMAGENDVLRLDRAQLCGQEVPLRGEDPALLVDGQLVRQHFQEFQGMELCLPFKADRPIVGDGDRDLPGERGRQAQAPGGLRLLL